MANLQTFDDLIRKASESGNEDHVKIFLEARESLGPDPTDEEVSDALREALRRIINGAVGEGLGDNSPAEDDEFLKDAVEAVKRVFADNNWHASCEYPKKDVALFELGFNIDAAGKRIHLDVKVYIESRIKNCRICATLPISAEDTYSLPLSKALLKINYPKRYGAFTYDERDGELAYDYCYPIYRGIHEQEFLRVFRAVLSSAADDDDYPVVRKYATGRLRNADKSELIDQINRLVEDMSDD